MHLRTDDGVDLWWEREGDGPTVVLLPGSGDASDTFPRALAAALHDGGLSTLRYDPRDTGLSGDGGSTYTVRTMAEDARAVMDAAGVEAAHLVGLSMAGLMLVHLATVHPERVRSLVFVSAMSPDADAGMGPDFGQAREDRVASVIAAMGDLSDADRAWAIEELAAADRRARFRADAADRHMEAAFRLGWPTLDDLASIDAPTVVVHGRKDRVLPVRHGEALAAGIAGARLVVRDGMGHLPRPADWSEIARLQLDVAAHRRA